MASLLPENQTITKMLGIRSVVQDENAGSRFGEGTRNKENAGRSTVFGGKAALQPLGVSTRKALGNITNMKGGENAMPGPALKPGASSSKEGRRVLGDITNSGASKRPFEQSKSKPALQPSSHSTQQPLQPVIRAPIVTRSKAEIYADEGIERLAGKSWRELEAERKQREDAEIQSRVHRLTSSLPVWRPSIKSTKYDSQSDSDELCISRLLPSKIPARPLSPVKPQPDTSALLLPSSLDISVLPDIDLPELDLEFDELM